MIINSPRMPRLFGQHGRCGWGCRQLDSSTPATAQVLLAAEPDLAAGLPDELPGQSNCDDGALSYFSAASSAAAAAAAAPASLFGGVWSGSNPSVSGLSLGRFQPQPAPASALNTPRPGMEASAAARPDWAATSPSRLASLRPSGIKPVLNEVVCGTLMLAYERAGLWEQVRHAAGLERSHMGLVDLSCSLHDSVHTCGKVLCRIAILLP